MKKLILLSLVFVIINACSDSNSDDDQTFIKTITGTIVNADNVKVGAFSSDYWFLEDYSGDDDVVGHEFDGGTTGSFSPISFSIPDGDNNYSIDLPDNPELMGELIGWVDSNNDSVYDLGTEAGYFPVKNINGTNRTIWSFGYVVMGNTKIYLVSYEDDSGSQNDDLSIVGASGFNFNID